jgi:hypothetical protein
MSTLDFQTIFTTDMRDSRGSVMVLVELIAIDGNYTAGGITVTPEEFGLQSIEYIGVNNFFAFPTGNGSDYDADGDWTKAVDLQPTRVENGDGGFDWKLIVFLYAMDGAELPDGIPMEFIPEVPLRMMVLGTNKRNRVAV